MKLRKIRLRQIIETGFGKLVSSFQRFAEQRFSTLPKHSNFKLRKNLLQNLSESTKLSRGETGNRYEDILSPTEMRELIKLFATKTFACSIGGNVEL